MGEHDVWDRYVHLRKFRIWYTYDAGDWVGLNGVPPPFDTEWEAKDASTAAHEAALDAIFGEGIEFEYIWDNGLRVVVHDIEADTWSIHDLSPQVKFIEDRCDVVSLSELFNG